MADPIRVLLSAVEAFVPADDLEASHRVHFLKLLGSADGCFTRRWFQPGHVTASAFIVDPAGARLLLHRHRRLGRWLQMGGHLDEGEHPAEAALREGAEESGLADLRLLSAEILDLDVHAIPSARDEPEHLHFDVRYAVATDEPERIALLEAESEELRWFTLDEAAEALDEAGSRRAIRKIRGLLGSPRL